MRLHTLTILLAVDWVAKMLGHRATQMVIRQYHKYVPNLTAGMGTRSPGR